MDNEKQIIKGLEPIKLFLVDDDVVFLKSLEIDFLYSADFSIETFATGELCMASLNHCPDVIILDYFLDGIEMNAMNGIETLDRIKSYNPDIPVIICTGYSTKINEDRFKDIGINAVLMKPATFQEMADAVRKALDEGV